MPCLQEDDSNKFRGSTNQPAQLTLENMRDYLHWAPILDLFMKNSTFTNKSKIVAFLKYFNYFSKSRQNINTDFFWENKTFFFAENKTLLQKTRLFLRKTRLICRKQDFFAENKLQNNFKTNHVTCPKCLDWTKNKIYIGSVNFF